ncbi:MAG: Nramp family divalent metal transporter [Bacteroidales bacterium]|nr:Nramp family divalent metal transporter [Bacteroidales bacterium]
MKFRLRSIGPAALVTAAFIGPGTITTCTLAGAGYGYALLWALLFSVIATIVLQEMAARLGIITRKGLGEALNAQFHTGIGRVISVLLILSAIGIGNAAYETGNILGGALGLEALFGDVSLFNSGEFSLRIWGPVIGIIAFVLLLLGSYKKLEKVLVALVILMSIVFLATMISLAPHLGEIVKGLFVPQIPKGAVLTVAGLVGTTVVPYNLFLHAALVQEKWKGKGDLKAARLDIWISILLGGLVSMSIVITSAAAFFDAEKDIQNAADLAVQLEPILGNWATGFIGIGLFAAGLTSAITAPLAAAYATCGILGWKKDLKSKKFRIIWMAILAIGIVLSAIGLKPVPVIVFAQAANGILLPIIAIYLLWVMNDKKLLGEHHNRLSLNIIAGLVVLVAIFLGLRSILSVCGII